MISRFFFFNDTATTEIYTLSLHDALPIFGRNTAQFLFKLSRGSQVLGQTLVHMDRDPDGAGLVGDRPRDRKSTRLNSSHQIISYAVFCLKKKKAHVIIYTPRDQLRRLVSR